MRIFKIKVKIKGKDSTVGIMAKDEDEAEAIIKGMEFVDKTDDEKIMDFFKGFKK